MNELEKGQRVRRFFQMEAEALLGSYLTIETLLPSATKRGAAHQGEEGRHIESLLRSFLNKHLPGNLRAVSGFILCPATKTGIQDTKRVEKYGDRNSTQLDVIVYDLDAYPVFERFEEFCIVPPEGVVGIISVKKKLYTSSIRGEVAALKEAALLCAETERRGPFTGLFAFSAEEADHSKLSKRIFDEIQNVHSDGEFDSMLNEASVLGRLCVFKNRPDKVAGNARYVGVDCRGDQQHVPLQRILQSLFSVYYDSTRGAGKQRPGFASFERRTFARAPELGLVRESLNSRLSSSQPANLRSGGIPRERVSRDGRRGRA
ncbi:DUF6602 domain-containing protein [Reyranella sp.]|uniref:DUF6602 domain-containing protein n=1 Tax=Reyranella sp. TaxID=1929291 RepID=UPI003F71D96F